MNTDRVSRSMDPNKSRIAAEIGELHRQRGQVWVRRQAEAYLSFYWDDAVLFVVDGRMTVSELRQAVVAEFEAGGGPLTIDLPAVDDIAISSGGDAATAGFEWRARIRSADGVESDRSYYETDVWYHRNGIWKIICMHLMRLSLSPI